MILVSFGIVLVAIALLIIGLAASIVGLIYASIAFSVIAFALLFLGVRGRKEPAPGDAPATAGLAPAPTPSVAALDPAAPADTEAVTVLDGPVDEAPAGSRGDVLVISGRPRYHAAGCRFIAGRDEAEALPYEEAVELGFSACGVCKPDAALPAAASPTDASDDTADGPGGTTDPADTADTADTADAELPAAAPVRRPRKSAPAAVEPEPQAAPVKAARTRASASAAVAPAVAEPVVAAATRTPAKRAAAAAVGTAAPAKATTRASVVVIPDRDRFHRPDCRFVRDVAGTETLAKTAATRQGYQACGVCKP